MSLLMTLIIGGLIGWLASMVAGRREGAIASIIIGIVGAFIGSGLSRFFGSGTQSFTSFTWSGVFWSFLGSIVLIVILNALQRGSHTSN